MCSTRFLPSSSASQDSLGSVCCRERLKASGGSYSLGTEVEASRTWEERRKWVRRNAGKVLETGQGDGKV